LLKPLALDAIASPFDNLEKAAQCTPPSSIVAVQAVM